MLNTAKLIVCLLIVLSSFSAGWKVKGAFEAKRNLAILEAKNEFINAYQKNEANIAGIVQSKLDELRANERIIERDKIKIIDRPVYSNECIDDDGLHIIESARTGKASAINTIE